MRIHSKQHSMMHITLAATLIIGLASFFMSTATVDASVHTASSKTKQLIDTPTIVEQPTAPQLAITNTTRTKQQKAPAKTNKKAVKPAKKVVKAPKKGTINKSKPHSKKTTVKQNKKHVVRKQVKAKPVKKKSTKRPHKPVKPKVTKKKKTAPVRKTKLAPLYNAPYIKKGKPYGRPQLTGAKRLAFEKAVYNWQIKTSPDRKLRDPYPPREILHWKPGQSRKNKVDFGHKKHHEYKKWFDMYKYRKITLQQFKAHEFNPKHFYIQSIGKNRSRIYEAK